MVFYWFTVFSPTKVRKLLQEALSRPIDGLRGCVRDSANCCLAGSMIDLFFGYSCHICSYL